jgi:hypothetical protein
VNSIVLTKTISIAFADSKQPLGVGANISVKAEFPLSLGSTLKSLEHALEAELAHWDHKHLGLDVGPRKYSLEDFAGELWLRLQNYNPLSLHLKTSTGSGLFLIAGSR